MGMGRWLAPFGEEFSRLFDDFEDSWFRLEVLQRYTVPYEVEPLRWFLAGEPLPYDPDKEQWLALIRDAARAGKRMQRVHVVVEPPSDYLRYELVCEYADNVAAGEDVRLIPVQPGTWPSDVPRHDYWLFDDRVLCMMHYDEAGQLLGAELVDDLAVVAEHRRWRDVALRQSMTYREYLRVHEDLPLRLVS
jgi:hypothetical protein